MNAARGTSWLVVLFGGTVAIAAALGSAWLGSPAPRWGALAMITGIALVIAATAALGAARSGVGRVTTTAIAIFLFLVIVIGFGAPLWLPVETASSRLVLGLPLRAAIEIYGVGLFPALVLPLLYARSFRSEGLDEASIEALRVECARLRDAAVHASTD